MTGYESERDFLKGLAVSQFNSQYARKVDKTKCAIRSIPATYSTTHGYEIETVKQTDYVRIRMYFTLSGYTHFNKIRVEVDNTQVVGALGDEVYVMLGKVDPRWVEDGIYKFRWLPEDTTVYEYLNFVEDNTLLQFMEGDYLRLMEQPA